jgi:hypothetical protein
MTPPTSRVPLDLYRGAMQDDHARRRVGVREATGDHEMKKTMKAIEPEGFRTTARNAGEDDVEGHRHNVGRALDPEGLTTTARNADEDEDTEGHSMANALIGREISRAREIEIQRNLRAHAARDEARRPHKK